MKCRKKGVYKTVHDEVYVTIGSNGWNRHYISTTHYSLNYQFGNVHSPGDFALLKVRDKFQN